MVGLRYALGKDGKHSITCGGGIKILKWLVGNLDLGVCYVLVRHRDLLHVFAGNNYGSYGYGGGPRHHKYFQCTGSEQRLSQCESFNDTEESRSAGYDVGLYCNYGMLCHKLLYIIFLTILYCI